MAIPRAIGKSPGTDSDARSNHQRTVGHTSSASWEPLTEDPSRYIVMVVQGVDQSGKTHFAFTAPEPILCMTFDPGNIRRGVSRTFAGKKDIQLATFEIPKGLVASSALAVAAKAETKRYYDTFVEAVEGGYFRTVIMDREDEAWEIFRYDEFEGRMSAKPHNFTGLNSQYKAMLKMAEKNKKNLIMIDAIKDEWKNDKPTGKVKREGFKHLGMLSQLTLEAQVDDYDNFSIQVVRCRDDATKNGEMLTPEYLSQKMADLGYEYPIGEDGEAKWFELGFENIMTYLIGGKIEEWT